MAPLADIATPPSVLAKAAAHLIVGLAAGGITHLVFRQKFVVALVAAGIGVAAHSNLDAPIARKLSELGL